MSDAADDVLADAGRELVEHPETPFAALHSAVALTAAGDGTRLRALRAHAAGATDPVLRDVVAPLCDGLLAVVEDRWADAVRLIRPLLARLTPIGGSLAQREIVEDTYLHALIAAGHCEEAVTLLDARLDRRPRRSTCAAVPPPPSPPPDPEATRDRAEAPPRRTPGGTVTAWRRTAMPTARRATSSGCAGWRARSAGFTGWSRRTATASTSSPRCSAATKALQSVAIELLEEHLAHCVVEAAQRGGPEADEKVREASAAIARLVRS